MGSAGFRFDIYPEQTDEQPAAPVDYDLEKMLGELARKDPTAGVNPGCKALSNPLASDRSLFDAGIRLGPLGALRG